ncbi:protein Hit1p [[Candida] railenensis]|uniref:Protein Hit1p n=1 Tax=[Candida] railenensis TaxID=45579 RepID=A0A9P0QNT3_9ASCO|nr:protein Hit1p [[Candida] railenensis]
MLCGICNTNISKYRCPKCSVPYCSLSCFKGEKHIQLDNESGKRQPTTTSTSEESAVSKENDIVEQSIDGNVARFEDVLRDEQIQSMLKIKSLQFHLSTILRILNDPQLTNESTMEGRREIANKKLCNLRIGGIEENELIEDFVSRVLTLLA